MARPVENSGIIAIELPFRLQRWHEKLVQRVRKAYPRIKAPLALPHITLIYLDSMSLKQTHAALDIMKGHIEPLVGQELSIRGAGEFFNTKSHVEVRNLHLRASADSLEQVRCMMLDVLRSQELLNKGNRRNEEFNPHVSVGLIVGEHRRISNGKLQSAVDILEKEDWSFRMSELVLYRGEQRFIVKPSRECVLNLLTKRTYMPGLMLRNAAF